MIHSIVDKIVDTFNQWKAVWIWPQSGEISPNRYVEFRRDIHMSGVNAFAQILRISARNEYELYVNGQFVGRGPSPSTPEWQYYDSYDLRGILLEGLNTIAVVCYHFGNKDIVTGQNQGAPGFILQLNHGDEVVLSTDDSWKSRVSARWVKQSSRISQWGTYKEVYKAAEEDGWEVSGYDDSEWETASFIAEANDETSPWPHLIPREIGFLANEKVWPRSIVRTEANFGAVEHADKLADNAAGTGVTKFWADQPGSLPSIVYDYENQLVGRPVIRLHAPQGGVLRVGYGESLELEYVDTFILKNGDNLLRPFGRRIGRFMQLTVMAAAEPVVIQEFSFEFTHYDFKLSGSFASSDPLLDRIWNISHYTTIMNSHDHLEDCPWREKALWVVDAVVMGKVIYNTFGDTLLLRKCLQQGAYIQNEDGSIPGTGPESNSMLLPDFCAYWLLGVNDYWKYSGDLDFVREIWPNMQRVAAWFEAQKDETGLFSRADRPGWWCFIDWTDVVEKKDKVAGISFLHYKVLCKMATMAAVLGELEQSHSYQASADQLLKDCQSKLWHDDKQLFADCMNGSELSSNLSLQTNFLAIWCGISTDKQTEYFLDVVYEQQQLPAVRGPFFQHIVLEVLESTGRTDRALKLIRDYWGEMVARGATTWWETFDAATPHCTIPSTYMGNTPTYLWEGVPISHCHGWGASPAYLLTRSVLGVDISELGQGELRLRQPQTDLVSASGEVPTVAGPIIVEWVRQEDGTLAGSVTVPRQWSAFVRAADDYPFTISQQ